MIILRVVILFLAASLVSDASAAGQPPLFSDEAPLNAVLTAPLSKVYASKKDDVRLYMPATLSFLNNSGEKQRLDLSLKTRGVYRRANCRLPPLLLNFKKKSTTGTVFEKQNKMKLVSPCSFAKSAQQRLVLEYLAYRAFEVVTDKSLHTRLVRMSYIDGGKKKKPWTHLTFLIEDEKDLAKRHDLKAVHVPKVLRAQLNQSHSALVELFQFMIGNTDFSMTGVPGDKDCCHNMQVLGHKGASGEYLPVPYDFDSAGLVDAKYAAPASKLPIKDVKTRLYRGMCRPADVMSGARDIFQDKRAAILALFSESEYLDERSRKKSVKYLNEFFDILNDPKQVQRQITDKCRG